MGNLIGEGDQTGKPKLREAEKKAFDAIVEGRMNPCLIQGYWDDVQVAYLAHVDIVSAEGDAKITPIALILNDELIQAHVRGPDGEDTETDGGAVGPGEGGPDDRSGVDRRQGDGDDPHAR